MNWSIDIESKFDYVFVAEVVVFTLSIFLVILLASDTQESLPFAVLVRAPLVRGLSVMSFLLLPKLCPRTAIVSGNVGKFSFVFFTAMPLQLGVTATSVRHFESAMADTPVVSERTGEQSPSRSAVWVSSVSSHLSLAEFQ